jgi:putative peptide zinc metalloprotease protein
VTGGLGSSQWFRVAALAPRLRGHLRVHRHVYRGKVWYALEDPVAHRTHRFNPAAWRVIRRLDGRRSLQRVWDELLTDLQDDSPTQDEIVHLIGQLNAADLIAVDTTPDVAELFERRERHERQRLLSRMLNPLSLRFPLWDPDRVLQRLARATAGIPAWAVALGWLAVVVPALLMLPPHWTELSSNVGERLLAADNLWVLAISFPLLKAAHEMAHGLAVRRRGGEVHEMGLMLLLFYPVPYVDASAANAFPRKRQRMVVGAAGMLAEIWLATIAFFLWLALEPGLARAVAYNVIVVGSVSTVLFNANPLLRYDGYYMLADGIEIPNLGQRSNQYWLYLISRHLLGVVSATPPPATRAERRWFAAYAPLAAAYRLFVSLGIAWFVAQHYFFVGVLLGGWSLVTVLLLPLWKGLRALTTQPQYTSRAGRVWGALGATAAAFAAGLFVLPLPHHTPARGIVALPENALLRARADGFVAEVVATPGRHVGVGDAVLVAADPTLAARRREQEARVELEQARLDAAWSRPAEAGRIREQLQREQAALDRLTDEMAELRLRPPSGGRLLLDQPEDLPGRWLRKGERVGHVVGNHVPLVRVIVPQAQAQWVHERTRRVEVLLPQPGTPVLEGRLVRAVPQASRELPSPALGPQGGGSVVTDPRDPSGVKALETLFTFEVELPGLRADESLPLGSRAYVSFEHPAEPIGWRWLRQLRTQFLSQFEV